MSEFGFDTLESPSFAFFGAWCFHIRCFEFGNGCLQAILLLTDPKGRGEGTVVNYNSRSFNKDLLLIIEVLNLQGQHKYIRGCKYNCYIWRKVKRCTHYTDLGPLLSQTLSRFLQLSCIFIGQFPSHFHLIPWHQLKFEDDMDAKQIRNAVR